MSTCILMWMALLAGAGAWPDTDAHLKLPALVFPKGFGKRRIFIDAGHGPQGNRGNTSCFCEREDGHTLRVAAHLARALEATGRFRVRVSREEGESKSYRKRLAAARRFRAQVILSIHSDARGWSFPWSPRPGSRCYRNRADPGFAVLWSKHGRRRLVKRRLALARAIAARMEATGLLPYDGNDYVGLYDPDPDQAGVFLNRQARGIYFLDRPRMPSVIIETHHALDPREERAFKRPEVLDAFSLSVAAALVDFFSR